MTIDVNALVRGALEGSDEISVVELSQRIVEAIPKGRERDVLAQVMPVFVRYRMSRERQLSEDEQLKPDPTKPVRRLTPVHKTVQGKGGKRYASRKVQAVAEGWLNDMIHAGTGRHVRLAKATYQDLLFAATELRTMAEQQSAKALKYEYLAELLISNRVQTVEELPAAIRAEAKEKVAA